jgi:hypothetical protein
VVSSRSAAFTSTISKVQVLRLFGFHSLVTTPDAATTEVYDYENTPGAAAIEAATETFHYVPRHDPVSHGHDIGELNLGVDSLALRLCRPDLERLKGYRS